MSIRATKGSRAQKPKIYASASSLPRGVIRMDVLQSALRELFFIENPQLDKNDPKSRRSLKNYLAQPGIKGVWIYYPWLNTAIFGPPEHVYYRLRTARNRDLISDKEQHEFRDAVVGVAGLSVGSAAVSTLVSTGGPKQLRIADPDHIEISNLNRINATLRDVGSNKADVAAKRIWELDPFADVAVWRNGVSRGDLKPFMKGLDVFVDEMDDIELKVASRLVCRDLKIPVVMATDNGDSVIVDIERFDLEPRREIFHGNVRISPESLRNMTRREFIALSSEIIDPEYFTERQQQSILNIGKSLSGVAQLGTAAAMAGAAVAYVVRRIATNKSMPSGRYVISCEHTFIPGYDGVRQTKMRKAHTKDFIKSLGLTTRA